MGIPHRADCVLPVAALSNDVTVREILAQRVLK
jgi:hypothetical protein